MERKKLGGQGLEVSELGLGCMGMSEFYGETNEMQALQTIDRALELGVTFFDTADMYGFDEDGMGANEKLIGRALAPQRQAVQIATKFGNIRSREQHLGHNGSPAYVQQACEASLKRLGTDYIDLYYLHRVDPKVPIEETVGAMARLVEAGKVRYLGLSEATSDQLHQAYQAHPLTALQTEYSLWSREPEIEVLTTCRELGIGFVPYSPLGRGFLTGTITSRSQLSQNDWRAHNPRFSEAVFDHNLQLVTGIQQLAAQKGCTPAQLALAWVLAQGLDIIPIPGTKRVKYLEENVQALTVTFSKAELDQLNTMAPIGFAEGARY